MEKNEMNPNPQPKNVEELFIVLENIFDNYDGYDRRLKAYYELNKALNKSEGEKQPDTESKCNKHIVSQQRELLIAFSRWMDKNVKFDGIRDEEIDSYLTELKSNL